MAGLTLSEHWRRIVDQYRRAGAEWPAKSEEIAQRAIDNGLAAAHPRAFLRQCAEEISCAMREEYIVDPQGRSVRAKHAARDGQTVLWDDIRTAGPHHMDVAFAQRRQQIVGDCRQLKTDVDSYNENANPGPQIVMVFDFTDDLAELEAIGL